LSQLGNRYLPNHAVKPVPGEGEAACQSGFPFGTIIVMFLNAVSELCKEFPELSLPFFSLASTGGFIALGGRCGQTAGHRLRDPVTGDDNLPYAARFLPNSRSQCLIWFIVISASL